MADQLLAQPDTPVAVPIVPAGNGSTKQRTAIFALAGSLVACIALKGLIAWGLLSHPPQDWTLMKDVINQFGTLETLLAGGRLADLEPVLLRYLSPGAWDEEGAPTVATADGIRFLCPKCLAEKGNSVGVHSVLCWTPKVPADMEPRGPADMKPRGRWSLVGSSFDDLSLVAGSSSILLTSGCCAHFFVRHGQIEGL